MEFSRAPRSPLTVWFPKYQKPMKVSQAKKGKRKKKADPEEWYAGAVRMLMTDDGEVGFTCRSRECLRTQCKLNLQNPKRKDRQTSSA